MCKNCARGVQTLPKSLWAVHNLCARQRLKAQPAVRKTNFSHAFPLAFTLLFSTPFDSKSPLFLSRLYPSSTVPITNTLMVII